MVGLSDSKEYAYAKRHGEITNKHKTDVQISEAVRTAMSTPFMEALSIKNALEDGSLVAGKINWQKFYGSANGNFIVRNTTKYRLHNLKYVVHFSSSSTGSEITQDDGYVKVGDLMPGESTSASFYSSYVGSANWARVTLHIDEDDLYDAILEQ